MEITILCDQKDCRFNIGNKVHHDHANDKCTHLCPKLELASIPDAAKCMSKERDMTDPSKQITTQDLLEIDEALEQKKGWSSKTDPIICANCKEEDKEYCVNICPIKRS